MCESNQYSTVELRCPSNYGPLQQTVKITPNFSLTAKAEYAERYWPYEATMFMPGDTVTS